MAIQKSIVDIFGATHATSYTNIYRLYISSVEAAIEMTVYHDAAARSKNDLPSTKSPLYQITGQISPADFATFFQDSVLDNNGVSPLKQAYAWLKTQTDFMDQNWTTGTTDV